MERKNVFARIAIGTVLLSLIQRFLYFFGIDTRATKIGFIRLLALDMVLLLPIRLLLKKVGVKVFQ